MPSASPTDATTTPTDRHRSACSQAHSVSPSACAWTHSTRSQPNAATAPACGGRPSTQTVRAARSPATAAASKRALSSHSPPAARTSSTPAAGKRRASESPVALPQGGASAFAAGLPSFFRSSRIRSARPVAASLREASPAGGPSEPKPPSASRSNAGGSIPGESRTTPSRGPTPPRRDARATTPGAAESAPRTANRVPTPPLESPNADPLPDDSRSAAEVGPTPEGFCTGTPGVGRTPRPGSATSNGSSPVCGGRWRRRSARDGMPGT